MRKTLLLSAALLASALPGAFAQTAPGTATGAATPMATPGQAPVAPTASPSAAPAEMPMPAKKMKARMRHHGAMAHAPMTHASMPADSSEIRPGHEPGVGDSFPASDKASNISAGDTRSTIAPRLPAPAGGGNATPAMLLADAQKALDARQSGRAQEALERAETAMLQRSVSPDQAGTPDQQNGVMQVQMARDALAKGDMAGAKKAIMAAMAAG